MITAAWAILTELAPWLLLGTAASALLHRFVPAHWLQTRLSGRAGVLRAVALGVPMPLCSCGVIPAGVGLKRDGASTGSAIGFMVSTPQTGVDSVLVTASMLGWPFALFKVGAAAVTGIAAGFMADAVDDTPMATAVAAGPAEAVTNADAVTHAVEVLRSIWRWLVFGILVSAALTTFVPAEVLSDTVLGSGVVAVLAVLLLSVPLYVCATASVPIAASLVAAGLPPAAALVFLMAGPATNVATIGAVKRTFSLRIVGVYLGTVIVGSVALGLLFDALFTLTAPPVATHVHTSPVAVAAAVFLAGVLATFAAQELREFLRPAAVDAPTVELSVEGLTCGGCERKLSTALRALDGVVDARVDHVAGRAIVHGTVGRDRLEEIVIATGFGVQGTDTSCT